ncbi:putative phage abortive infection protein [Leptospira kirschneri]|uniref:putative phage abortive infection protein n=1 Tax=Leptospira kirschneri TaxID=29507 RepID=UPI0035673DBB
MKKKLIIIGFLILIITLLLLHIPLLFKPFSPWSDSFNSTSAANYGALISGYAGIWLLTINIFLLLFTQFNQSIYEFDRKFYTFLSIHRDNVKNFRIANFSGVNAIEKINFLFDAINRELSRNITKSLHECINTAYLTIYFGLNSKSLSIYLFNYKEEINQIRILYFNMLCHEKSIKSLLDKDHEGEPELNGMEQYLSVYFRHLFYTVESIRTSNILSETQKKEYFSILRAQLSVHEQALILLNFLSQIGKTWNRNGVIEKYQLIKDIPFGYFDSFDQRNVISNIQWAYQT